MRGVSTSVKSGLVMSGGRNTASHGLASLPEVCVESLELLTPLLAAHAGKTSGHCDDAAAPLPARSEAPPPAGNPATSENATTYAPVSEGWAALT